MPKSYNRKADLSDSKPCPLSPILCFLGDSSTGISNHQVCSTHRAPEQGQEGQGEVQIQEFLRDSLDGYPCYPGVLRFQYFLLRARKILGNRLLCSQSLRRDCSQCFTDLYFPGTGLLLVAKTLSGYDTRCEPQQGK